MYAGPSSGYESTRVNYWRLITETEAGAANRINKANLRTNKCVFPALRCPNISDKRKLGVMEIILVASNVSCVL